MNDFFKRYFFRSPRGLRWGLNLWPPLFFSGIKVVFVSEDLRCMKVMLKRRPWTLNMHNAQYGGSLFSMTDPVYLSLVYAALGWEKYYIWDQAAEIEYVRPARGKVFFEARVSQDFVQEIVAHTQNGEKYLPWAHGEIVDEEGVVVARVRRQLYVRLKRAYRPLSVE